MSNKRTSPLHLTERPRRHQWAALGRMTLDEARHRHFHDAEFFALVGVLAQSLQQFRLDEVESAVEVATEYAFHDLRRLIDAATAAGEPVPDELRTMLEQLRTTRNTAAEKSLAEKSTEPDSANGLRKPPH